MTKHLPAPDSNRVFAASLYVQTMMLHTGGDCLDDVRQLREYDALLGMLNIKPFPSARSPGSCLHRMSDKHALLPLLIPVNQCLLSAALGDCKAVILDIDATEIVSNKKVIVHTPPRQSINPAPV